MEWICSDRLKILELAVSCTMSREAYTEFFDFGATILAKNPT